MQVSFAQDVGEAKRQWELEGAGGSLCSREVTLEEGRAQLGEAEPEWAGWGGSAGLGCTSQGYVIALWVPCGPPRYFPPGLYSKLYLPLSLAHHQVTQ